MGNFSLCQVYFMFWVVLVRLSDAEPLYFIQNDGVTWEEAVSQCEACFNNLMTVIPNTTYVIAGNLPSDYYWIGLRKYMSNFTDDPDDNSSSTMAWSRWANGAPLAFQNWYPGWPKFKRPVPNINCCSCSCTCPAATEPAMTGYDVTATGAVNTSFFNHTDVNTPDLTYPTVSGSFGGVSPATPFASQCEKTPEPLPVVPDPNRDYIEDSCVAMLSNGAWVEKNCTDLLPFICYEDRFYGKATVSNITASSAVVTWLPGPNKTSRYHLLVTNSSTYVVLEKNITQQPFSYTYQLENLLSGSRYDVTVFAIKCDRDVYNPQEASFYTIPNKVINISVIEQTNSAISLNWTEPDEDVDLFSVQYNNLQSTKTTVYTNSITFSSLTAGTLYTFTIWAGTNDTSQWSQPATVSAYTRPGDVTNLTVGSRDTSSVMVSWNNPSGLYTSFNVSAVQSGIFYNSTIYQNTTNISGLQAGTQVNITVTVLGAGGLQGHGVQAVGYTAPEPVSNVKMSAGPSYIYVTWSYSADVYSPFSLVLNSSADNSYNGTTNGYSFNFTNLKTATYYTVFVSSTILTTILSSPQSASCFTVPDQPTNPSVTQESTTYLMFQWNAPPNIGTSKYSVKLNSTFWGQYWSDTTTQTSYTFTNLTSGSNYTFEVRTLAGDLQSVPATMSAMTVSQPVYISLAMQCSSATPLLCATNQTMLDIFTRLNSTMNQWLGQSVSWKLHNDSWSNDAA